MLEIAFIRNNAEHVKERLAVKHFKELNLVDDAVAVDEKRRALQKQLDDNLAKQNVIAKEIGELFKQGKKDEAVKAYRAAWDTMPPEVEYRRFIEGKLTALGQAPVPAAAQTSSAAASSAP